jgi:hypothetical protein
LRNSSPSARVEDQDDRAQRDVRKREAGRVPSIGDVSDLDGHRRDREHPREVGEAHSQIVGVVARRIRHVSLPRDEDGKEERGEADEAERGMVGDEHARELGDRHDEDEVEEELEPARMSLALGRERPEARRLEPRRSFVEQHRLLDPDAHPAGA